MLVDVELADNKARAAGKEMDVVVGHPVNGVLVAPKGPIETGRAGVDHESGAAAQTACKTDQQQPQAEQEPLPAGEIAAGGAQAGPRARNNGC